MKTLYIECNMGAAGDMLMAALYELLSDEQKRQFVEKMNGLGLPGGKSDTLPEDDLRDRGHTYGSDRARRGRAGAGHTARA